MLWKNRGREYVSYKGIGLKEYVVLYIDRDGGNSALTTQFDSGKSSDVETRVILLIFIC